jgi:hypothetical protein
LGEHVDGSLRCAVAVRADYSFIDEYLPQGLRPLSIANLDGTVETVPLQTVCRPATVRSDKLVGAYKGKSCRAKAWCYDRNRGPIK